MAINFPDILSHENQNYAIVDVNQLRGLATVNNITERNNIPQDKRLLGSIVSIVGDIAYHYRGATISDSDWSNNLNWRALGISNSNNFVQFFSTVNDVANLCNHDNFFICCFQTGQIYTYISSGSQYTIDNHYVLATKDGGDSRFVSLFYNVEIPYYETIINCDGITNDYVINHGLNVKYVDLRCFDVLTNERVEIYYSPIDYMTALVRFEDPVPNNISFIIIVKQ